MDEQGLNNERGIGIDLGTTNCVVAFVNESGRTELLRNSFDEILTPSVIVFTENEVLVGRVAQQSRNQYPNALVECAKRDVGAARFSRPVRGKEMPPEVLQAYVLRELRCDIAKSFGECYCAVVTVPAYFDERRRQSTTDSAELAGLHLLDIINEPMAASLAYGERLGYLDESGKVTESLNVLVFDLGGGTFDVTVVRLSPDKIETLAAGGDVHLGGYDWDSRLKDHIWQEFCRNHGVNAAPDTEQCNRLLQLAAELKHTLSARSSGTISFSCQGQASNISVSRERFEELTADLLQRTRFTTLQVLRESGLIWDKIARVLLVGGATRMPMVRAMIESLAGIPPDDLVNPDEAVARGAAIYAEHLLARNHQKPGTRCARLTVTNVNSHSLGIEGINLSTLRKENVTVIPRNTSLPVSVCRRFVTKVADQDTVVIRVLEGESSSPDECIQIGRAVLRHLPKGRPAGFPIDVVYSYDSSGRLAVSASMRESGESARIELQRVGGLSAKRLQRWRTIVSSDGGLSEFETWLEDFENGPEVVQEGEELLPPAIDLDDEFDDVPNEPAIENQDRRDWDELRNTEPVVDQGAPLMASQVLRRGNGAQRKSPRRPNQLPFGVLLLGHVLASILGLCIGYYLLCHFRPDLDFLRLNLPGIAHPTEQSDQVGN